MLNVERAIRFSDITMEELNVLSTDYHSRMYALLEANSPEFCSLMEGKTYLLPKKQLQAEGEKLAKHKDPVIANFGKEVVKFFASGFATINGLMVAISGILTAGGAVLATCITLILAILVFAVTVIPFATLTALLAKQQKTLLKVVHKNDDVNVKKYNALITEIQKNKDGIKDITELNKIIAATEASCEINDGALMESNVEYKNVKNILTAIETKQYLISMESEQIGLSKPLVVLERCHDLAPKDDCYYKGTDSYVLESVDFMNQDDTENFMTLEQVVAKPMLASEGLLHGAICIVTDACDQTTIAKFLNSYKETAKYEFTHESFRDIPLIAASNAVLEFIHVMGEGSSEVMESEEALGGLFEDLLDEAYDEVKEDAVAPSVTDTGFNPDPFSLGSLTPFPVGCRKVGELMDTINDAETDEELTEAMLQFGRVTTAINEQYEISTLENGTVMVIENNLGKAARNASDKVQEKFSKTATKDKTGGVKEAVKKTVDPMEKFIEKQYQTLKEKDKNERREILIKGGVVPKIMRWLKRGIGLLAGSVVGQLIPPVAIASGIAFIGFIATDKYLDRRERTKLLQEIEDEIQICNEKIDDSRGDDNKQNKYELMRIRNDLKRTQDKIRFGLKY